MSKANGYLSRDAILSASDLTTEEVAVPEWGGTVRVKSLTGAERDVYESSIVTQRRGGTEITLRNARARLVSLAAVDADGTRLFSDADVMLLGNKSARALERVFDVAARLSRLTEQDMDDLLGNSGSGPSADSVSASPSPSA